MSELNERSKAKHVYDAFGRKFMLPIVMLAIVAVGLWKWLAEGDAAEGLGGILAAVAVCVALEIIYRRSGGNDV